MFFISSPIASIALILAGIANLVLGFFVFYKARKGHSSLVFYILCLCLSFWCFGLGLLSSIFPERIRIIAVYLSFLSALPLPFVLLLLSFVFPNGKFYFSKSKLFFISLPAIIFLPIVFNKHFIQSDIIKEGYIHLRLGVFYYLHLLYFIPYILLAAKNFFYKFKVSQGMDKMRFKYFFVSFLFTAIIGVFCNLILIVLHIDKFGYVGPLGTIFFVSFTAYAIVKYQLMDIRVAITRSGIFLCVYALTLGLPFYVGRETQSWVISTIFAVVIATVGSTIYRFLQKEAENLILAKQRRYQRILLQAAAGMVREHNLDRLLKLTVYIIKRIVNVRFAAIFFHDVENKIFVLKASRDHKNIFDAILFKDSSPLSQYIQAHLEPITQEELPHDLYKGLEQIMGSPVALIIPAYLENNVLGFLVLGEKNDQAVYSEDDINVFRILSRQAALAIKNCLFLEEFKKTQEKVFYIEKLASMGGMAEGVVHQMKNHLNDFYVSSAGLKYGINDFIENNSQRMASDTELKKIFNEIVSAADYLIANVKKTDEIINAIFNFSQATQKISFFSQFSLKEIITCAVDLLKIKHHLREFPIECALGSSDSLYGVKAQIMESIYNILDNCYEAIEDKQKNFLSDEERKCFVPLIKLSFFQKDNKYVIEISDNGIGIREEHKGKMFAPFFTTKVLSKSGTGIGMYVVKRMIEENHHGKIWFESIHSQGTKFIIELPLK